jgi:hypothetical protein
MTKQLLSSILQTPAKYTGEPTGFPTTNDSTIAFDQLTRTFTITPTDGSFAIYFNGVSYEVIGPQSVVVPNVTATHYIYFDATTKALSYYTMTDTDTDAIHLIEILKIHVVVSVIYWNATISKAVLVAEERHGMTMDSDTHIHLHVSLGAQWVSGLALDTIIADGNGSSNTHAQFDCANGIIRDEDLRAVITDGLPQELSPIISIPTLYRIGTGWRITPLKNFPYVLSGEDATYTNTLPAYNYQSSPGVWALAPVSNNSFLLSHILATNDIRHPIVSICGNTYGNITDARTAALTELRSIASGLPFAEYVPLGTIISQCSTAYTNTPKAIFRSTSDGKTYVDLRSTRSLSSVGSGTSVPAALNYQAVTTSQYTATSTSSTVPSLSFTIPLAGNYIVTYSLSITGTGTTTNNRIFIDLDVDGTLSPTHSRASNVLANASMHVGTVNAYAVGAVVTLKARSIVTDGAVRIEPGSILSYIRLS